MAKQIKAALVAAIIVFTAGAATVGFAASGMGALTFGVGMGLTATGMAVFTFATTLIAGAIGKLTSKGINANAGNFGSKFASRQGVAPRQIIYGKCRVGGTIAHLQTTGTDNYLLHMIVVVAGHEVEDIETVRINDVNLTTTTSTVSGSTVYTATNADFTNTDNDNNFGSGRLLRYTKKLGTDSQGVDGFMDAQLASITTNHRFRGCAYVYMQMVFDAEKFGGGVPAVSFIVKGKKVYDPRTDTTVWSDNPALCIRDYLTNTTYGLKATTSEINDTTSAGGFASAANTCEQTVTLADNVTTEERYTANGFTNMSATGTGILEGLLSSCAGKLSYVNGKFNIFVGASQTPSLTITDENLLQPIAVTTNKNTGELYNTVKPVFVDSTQDYNATDAPVLQDSTLLGYDTPSGETSANYVKQFEPQLPYTVTHTMAQRLGKIQLLHQRQTTTISCLVDTKFLRLQPNDWVYVTNDRLSFSNKTFEVVSMNLELIGEEVPVVAVRLNLKEIENAVYGYVYNEYSTPIDEGSDEDTGDFSLSVPTSLALVQQTNKDSTTTKVDIKATWTNVASDRVQGTEITWKLSTDGSYTSSMIVGKNVGFALIPNVVTGKTYNVKVRHFSGNNVYSDYTSVVNISITKPTDLPSAPTNLTASDAKPFNIVVSWTNPSQSDLRAVKIYRRTTNTTPTDDTYLVATLAGEPSATSTLVFGKQDGLIAGTTYYFWARAINHSDVHSAFTSVETGSYSDINTADITDGLITTLKLADDAVTNAKIAVDAIQGDVIAAGAITTTKIGSDAVTNAKLANDAVTSDIIAAGAVTTTEIADNAISTAKIIANAITTAKIATNAVTANEIAANTITAGQIATGAISTDKLAANAVTAAKIAANTITASQIAAGTITATQIAADTITAANIAAGAIATSELAANAVTAAKIAANTITASEIASNTITANEIAANAITASEISANAVSADKMNVSTLSSITANVGTLTAGSIDASTLTISNINASNISTGTLSASRLNIDGITLENSGGQLIIKSGGVDTGQIATDAVTTTKVANNSISGFVASTGSQYFDYNDFYPDGSASETKLGYAYQSGTGSGGSIYTPNEAVMVETGIMLTPSSGTTSIVVIGHTINNVDAASSSDFITLRLQWRRATTSGGVSSVNYSDVRLYTMYGASAESFQTLTGTVPSSFTSNGYYYQFRLTMRASGVTTLAGTTRSYGPATVMALTTVK